MPMKPWKKAISGFLTAAAMQPMLSQGANSVYSRWNTSNDHVAFLKTEEQVSAEKERRVLSVLQPEIWREGGETAASGDITTMHVVNETINERRDNLPEEPREEYLQPVQVDFTRYPRVKRKYDELISDKNSVYLDILVERARTYQHTFEEVAERYDIPRGILYAIAVVESGANASINRKGMMQITPIAAKHLNSLQDAVDCSQTMNPEINIECGGMLLRSYFDGFADKSLSRDEQWISAIAAYNRGKAGTKGDLRKARIRNPLQLKQSQTTAEAYWYAPKVVAMVRALEQTSLFEE